MSEYLNRRIEIFICTKRNAEKIKSKNPIKKKKKNEGKNNISIDFNTCLLKVFSFFPRFTSSLLSSADGRGPDGGQRGHRDYVHVRRTRRRSSHFVLRTLPDWYIALKLWKKKKKIKQISILLNTYYNTFLVQAVGKTRSGSMHQDASFSYGHEYIYKILNKLY